MKLILLGAGHIGQAIAEWLHDSGDYDVTVADRDVGALAKLTDLGVTTEIVDSTDLLGLTRVLSRFELVVNALPYQMAVTVATAAKAAGTHYFDLTEDVHATQTIRSLAEGAGTVFMPQCGLAPGFIGIAAHELAKRFSKVRDIKMRVGALPEFPTNELKYNLTWSVDGLVNEYCHPCEAIRGGRREWVQPLEGLEHFSLDGVEYEAFNTSGGLGTLCETLAGKVDSLDYKSVRYPGHRKLMKFLLEDLRLKDDQEKLKDIMRAAVPSTMQDVVLVFITVSGERDGQLIQEAFSRKIFAQQTARGRMSAIQMTTAAGICAAVDLFCEGRLPRCGFIGQEAIALDALLANRFGCVYNAHRRDEAGATRDVPLAA
ncbi:MAG TPA: saccharopine dehydrogenase C-terminal domain-containing protein [Pararobbsia sp.]|jgi:saccharopine dehydrogenase-like NADP-dependent oxidoreductase|nr:saccharopine dehydrogenase C-terminal domain-containing protein [Pararobbsia sp.]